MQAGSSTALIVADMLNPYDHEDAEALMDSVGSVVPVLQSLIDAQANKASNRFTSMTTTTTGAPVGRS